ncbi:MAG: lysophospholipid acyltransferase family protein, partial [Pseudobdellovibrionaceae bacterium]
MIERAVASILSLAVVIVFPFWVALWSIVVMAPRLFGNSRPIRDFQNWALHFWGIVSCSVFRVKIRVHGKENLPKAGGLVLFNHQSLIDIIILQYITGRIKFGAKIELFKVPFFGPAMRLSGMLPIARDNVQDVIRVYKEAEARAAQGELFALAPEGTRQKVDQLGPFKSGPFIFAI